MQGMALLPPPVLYVAAAGRELSWPAGLTCLAIILLFLLALRDMARAHSARRGLRLGMAGMALAIGAVLVTHDATFLPQIGLALLLGGAAGLVVARRTAMASLPSLRTAFYAFLGLAAMLTGTASWIDPDSFGVAYVVQRVGCAGGAEACDLVRIIGEAGALPLALGVALGALTFAGAIAVLLNRAGGRAMRPALRHAMSAVATLSVLILLGLFARGDQGGGMFAAIIALSLLLGALWMGAIDSTAPLALSSAAAAVALGFAAANAAMVVTGALVATCVAVAHWRRTATGSARGKKQGA